MTLFDKKKIGLNISDNSAELVEISFVDGHEVLSNYSRINLQNGFLKNSHIKNVKELEKAILNLFASAKNGPVELNNVIFGISEDNIFSHLISVNLKREEYKEIIKKKIKSVI